MADLPEQKSIDASVEFSDPIPDLSPGAELGTLNSEPEAVREIQYRNPQVKIDRKPLTPRVADDKDNRLPIALHRLNDLEVTELTRNAKNFDSEASEDGQRWMRAFQLANYCRVAKGVFLDQLSSPDNSFKQYIEYEGNRIANGEAPFTLPKGGGKLSGDRAILFLQSTIGSGEQRTIVLPASGLWLTIRPSPDTNLSNLETLVGASKEHIGRLTSSLALSNTMVYMVGPLIDFILEAVVDSNVVDATPEILRDLILTTDIHALATGAASTIYPNGYPLMQPCVADPFNCQFLEESTLNLRYITLYETNRLTTAQRAFLANKNVKRTVEQIKEYQAMGPVTESEVVDLPERRLKISFRSPSVTEYMIDGNMWIDSITKMIDSVTQEISGDEARRRQLVEDQARLTTLRQYGHFIKQITILDEDGTERIIQDSLTLNAAVNELSSADDILTATLTGIRRHIGRATIAFIGIPKMPCPMCGKSHDDVSDGHHDIVPIDAVNLFFTLLSLKLSRRQKKRLTAV